MSFRFAQLDERLFFLFWPGRLSFCCSRWRLPRELLTGRSEHH